MQINYYNKLQTLRSLMEMHWIGFPKDCCMESSRTVFHSLGLREIAGTHDSGAWHAWNYDEDRSLYICLTADQFNLNTHPISIVPITMPIFRERSRETLCQRSAELTDSQDGINVVLTRFQEKYS